MCYVKLSGATVIILHFPCGGPFLLSANYGHWEKRYQLTWVVVNWACITRVNLGGGQIKGKGNNGVASELGPHLDQTSGAFPHIYIPAQLTHVITGPVCYHPS